VAKDGPLVMGKPADYNSASSRLAWHQRGSRSPASAHAWCARGGAPNGNAARWLGWAGVEARGARCLRTAVFSMIQLTRAGAINLDDVTETAAPLADRPNGAVPSRQLKQFLLGAPWGV